MNIVIAIALFRFLSLTDPRGTFTSRAYSVASSMILACLGLFFYNRNNTANTMSCLDTFWDYQHLQQNHEHDIAHDVDNVENEITSRRQFPIACAFHVIVTGCYFFMNMGMTQCNDNIAAMENLHVELIQSKEDAENNKKKD